MKLLLPLFLCSVLLVGLAAAIPEPTLEFTFNLNDDYENLAGPRDNGDGPVGYYVFYPGDDYVGIALHNATNAILTVYQMSTGLQVYENIVTHFGNTQPVITEFQGFVVMEITTTTFGGGGRQFHVYDMSDPQFIVKEASIGFTDFTAQASELFIVEVNEGLKEIQLLRFLAGNQQHIEINYQGSGTQTPQNGPPYPQDIVIENITTVDRTNRIYTAGQNFVRYFSDPGQAHTVLGGVISDVGPITHWNGDPNNPEYLSENGFLVLPNDYLSPAVSSIAADTFEPFYFFGREQIYGELSNNGKINGLNFSNPVNPVAEIFSATILSSVVETRPDGAPAPAGLFGIIEAGVGRLQIFSVNVLEGAAEEVNQIPTISTQFAGTDSNKQFFVFITTISDLEGGTVFEAHDVDVPGAFSLNSTRIVNNIEFNDPGDLSAVSQIFDNDPNITFSTGRPQFDLDGALYVNETLGVTIPSITNGQFYDSTASRINVTTSFYFTSDASPPLKRSVSLLSVDNLVIGSLIFNQSATGEIDIYKYLPNSSILFVGKHSLDMDNSFVFLRSTIDFSNQTVNWEIRNGVTGTLLEDDLSSFVQTTNSYEKIRFGEESIEAVDLFIDNVQVAYWSDGDKPQFSFFANLLENTGQVKAIRVPVPGSFGTYESNFFATDSFHGTSNYTSQFTEIFEYDLNTPALTEQQINDLVVGAQLSIDDDAFTEGDFITDKLPSFLESIGLKTSFSRAFAGFIILLLVFGFLAGYPSEVQLLGVGIGFTLLTLFGFFPAWLLAIVIVLTVALFARAMRNVFAGQQ